MRWLRRVIEWFRGGRDADLREEMETHRALAHDELQRGGLTSAAAKAESHRRMGNALLAREDSREVWAARWIDRLRQHLRYGVRGLRREPAFALTTILTLGLGTAALTTAFSVADGELWRPLPYPQPRQLVTLQARKPSGRQEAAGIDLEELHEWRASLPALATLAAQGGSDTRTVRVDYTQSIDTVGVTANFFTTLGRGAIAGRVFSEADAHGSDAVIIGSSAWRRLFDSRADLIGRTMFIDNRPHTIVGIVETDNTRGVEDDVFLPLDESVTTGSPSDAGTFYTVIGRLSPGATPHLARTQLQSLIDRRGQNDRTRAGLIARVDDISDHYRAGDGRPLYFFLGASVLVLALTIINIAGLVLSRGLRRTPEFALRGALGGGGRAIAAQLLVEAALIAIPGCLLGLWLATEAVGVVSQTIPSGLLVRGRHIVVDYRAMAMCVAVIAVTMIGLALAPLGVARRADASNAMAGGARSSGLPAAGKARERMLIAQMALTVVLLVAGALFVKSFVAETRIPLGFDRSDGWSMYVGLNDPKFADMKLVRHYADALVERTRALPGVRDVAVATSSPLASGLSVTLTRPDLPQDQAGARTVYRAVGPQYFAAIGTAITRGRGFLASDVAGGPDVAVVNEEFVRQAFGGEDPIGQRVEIGGARTRQVPTIVATIVGVAANIKELRPNEAPLSDVYVPFAQRPLAGFEVIVRGNGSDTTMPAQLRNAAAEIDSSAAVAQVATLDRRVTVALQRDRFNLILASGFSIVALLVAAIGIYGAMAYASVARAREFGVRVALGATPAGLLRRALWHAARLGVIGAAIGVACAAGVAVWIGDALYTVPGEHNGLLYGVKTTDATAIGAAAAGVILMALVSGAVPARRLARVDPVKALRSE